VNNDHQSESSEPVPDSDLLRLIFESARDFAIFTIDPNGVTTSWNLGAERLLGYTSEEMIGHLADVIFPPEEGGADAAEEERRVALAQGRAEDDRWQMRKDGSRFWASGLLMPLAAPNFGFVKILRDLSQQHRNELLLKQSEELFRTLATSIPQLVFRSRSDGTRTWGSPQWSVFTGLAFSESVNLGWLDAVHPEDRDATLAAWSAAPAIGEYYLEQRIRRSPDGEYRWHQTRARPIGEGVSESKEWVGTSTDIHDLRTLQDRQKILLAELQHRTRNLLAVVQSIARQTIRSSRSLESFEVDYERRLRALGRVQSLLARTDYGQIDFHGLIDLELDAHGDDGAEGNKVTIEGPRLSLQPNSAQVLALALHELATNAVKYGAFAQPEGRVKITWRLENDSHHRLAHIVWQETGVRIPEGSATRKGYGRELIERALPYQLDARTKLQFESDGVRCEIEVPVSFGEKDHA
jgi:PAS domain S-box-containing protein